MHCATPRCERRRAKDKRFCKLCGERLARVRREIEAGATERKRSAGVNSGRRTIFKSCAWFECGDPAKPGESYCLHHFRQLRGLTDG